MQTRWRKLADGETPPKGSCVHTVTDSTVGGEYILEGRGWEEDDWRILLGEQIPQHYYDPPPFHGYWKPRDPLPRIV